MKLKINHPRELLGKIIWSTKNKEARGCSIIELAEYVFRNPDDFKYVTSFKMTEIEVEK